MVIVIMVVVMIIPVAIAVPAMPVFVPPLVIPVPAILADLMQNVTSVFRLGAVPAVMFGGFVEFVIGFGNATLTICFISNRPRSCCKEQKTA
ncbi:MAG: hypothetical protein ACRD5M_03085 [Candidatus Acidiferrales bacterium]